MQITVNGKHREVTDGTSVADLLEELEITVRHVAVERNRDIVPRGVHGKTMLTEGDELEVVTLVGGG